MTGLQFPSHLRTCTAGWERCPAGKMCRQIPACVEGAWNVRKDANDLLVLDVACQRMASAGGWCCRKPPLSGLPSVEPLSGVIEGRCWQWAQVACAAQRPYMCKSRSLRCRECPGKSRVKYAPPKVRPWPARHAAGYADQASGQQLPDFGFMAAPRAFSRPNQLRALTTSKHLAKIFIRPLFQSL